MSYSVTDVGGLAVAFSPADHRQVQRELTRLDPHLFLDPEVETHGPRGSYVYLTVKQHLGSAVPPLLVTEWRDANGPWPLSMAIVEKVKRQEGRMADAVHRVLEHNEKIRAESIRRTGDDAFEVARDARKVTGKTSAVLPRSQALRMSRDRARARGRKV